MPNQHHSRGINPPPDDLAELLLDKPDDESKGAEATIGFSYQQWWATLIAVEMLSVYDDYALGMEVKEDVAILDSSTKPTRVEFCQIKKNEQAGAWALSDLHNKGAKLKKGHEPSTLAKLYKRKIDFPGHNVSLRFVSNVGFKISAIGMLKKVHSVEARLKELDLVDKELIVTAISSQLEIEKSSVSIDEIRLHRSNLPMAEQEIFVAGKISQLWEERVLPFRINQPTVAARFLASEIQSRAASSSYAKNMSDLQARIMSRQQVMVALSNVASAKKSISETLDSAIATLESEKAGFLLIKKIKNERITICADSADRTNLYFRDIIKALHESMTLSLETADDNASLLQLMNLVVERCIAKNSLAFMGVSTSYLHAAALLVLNDGIDFDVLTASVGSQSEAEQ
jgi:hypothetical protein